MVKLDVTCMRHLSKHDIRVLTAVEVGTTDNETDSHTLIHHGLLNNDDCVSSAETRAVPPRPAFVVCPNYLRFHQCRLAVLPVPVQ